jgi:sec-independent protein translocase protein TatC
MTIIEHLEGLRRALIISAATTLLAALVAFIFARQLFDLLVERDSIPHWRVVYLGLTGGVLLDVKVALSIGLLAAAPAIIHQLWWFVSPGLHLHERRLARPMILATIVFFYLGSGFALFFLPLFVRVLTSLAPPDGQYLAGASELLGLIVVLVIAFGVVFELPVVLFLLGRIGIISSAWLYGARLYWVLGLALVANFMTPGVDPITPLILFVPLLIFWEATALLLKLTGH